MAAQPPHQPSGFAATVADSQVTLTWNAADPVDAVDNYQLNVKHVGENVGQTVQLARTATSTVVNFLTAPIGCLTLGLFSIVINGLMFWLAARAHVGVDATFLGATITALAAGLLSGVFGALTHEREERRRW